MHAMDTNGGANRLTPVRRVIRRGRTLAEDAEDAEGG
jgi:hypothetical protein